MPESELVWVALGVVVGGGLLAVTLWSARRYDTALSANQRQLEQAEAQQRQMAALLQRQETLLDRIEALVERFEREQPASEAIRKGPG